MANTETFREITSAEADEMRSRWNFIPVSLYARMVPVENEVGALVDIPQECADSVLRSGRVDGANIERLTLHIGDKGRAVVVRNAES